MMRGHSIRTWEFLNVGRLRGDCRDHQWHQHWIAMMVVAPVVVGIIGVIVRADNDDHPASLWRIRYDAGDLGPQSFSGGQDHGALRQYHSQALGAARQFQDRRFIAPDGYTLFTHDASRPVNLG